jgi:histo-blood group ABO system transferase
MNTINLLLVATNKYVRFLPELLASVDKHFFKNSAVDVTIFSDKVISVPEYNHISSVKTLYIEHKPFPYPTLHRFHFFKDNYKHMGNYDYYFYLDVDTLITADISEDILSDSIATQHCGFMNKRGSYETNPKSTAHVYANEGTHYFGGGFWGMGGAEFWHLVNHCVKAIDEDEKNGITAVWDDESHLNRYFIDYPPTSILSPSYHYPQSHIEKYKAAWLPKEYDCKILLLDKDHKEIRK